MAHYAILDENNIVLQVIVGKDEGGDTDWEVYYGNVTGKTVKRTSYNTNGNVHALGGTPFRKNYAGIGDTYDSGRDAFIAPKPFPSWTLDEDTCFWMAPVTAPTNDQMQYTDETSSICHYTQIRWDEDNNRWIAKANNHYDYAWNPDEESWTKL
jgi:hypothetical protein